MTLSELLDAIAKYRQKKPILGCVQWSLGDGINYGSLAWWFGDEIYFGILPTKTSSKYTFEILSRKQAFWKLIREEAFDRYSRKRLEKFNADWPSFWAYKYVWRMKINGLLTIGAEEEFQPYVWTGIKWIKMPYNGLETTRYYKYKLSDLEIAILSNNNQIKNLAALARY